MKNWITVLLLVGSFACTSKEADKESAQNSPNTTELTIVVLGNEEVLYDDKIIPVTSLRDEISSRQDSQNANARIELAEYITVGDVYDVTKTLEKSSIQKIIISEDLSLKILQLKLTGDGEVIINNDDQISLSALHSHLAALDRSKKIRAYLSVKKQTPAEDLFFAQRMLAENHIETIISK